MSLLVKLKKIFNNIKNNPLQFINKISIIIITILLLFYFNVLYQNQQKAEYFTYQFYEEYKNHYIPFLEKYKFTQLDCDNTRIFENRLQCLYENKMEYNHLPVFVITLSDYSDIYVFISDQMYILRAMKDKNAEDKDTLEFLNKTNKWIIETYESHLLKYKIHSLAYFHTSKSLDKYLRLHREECKMIDELYNEMLV